MGKVFAQAFLNAPFRAVKKLVGVFAPVKKKSGLVQATVSFAAGDAYLTKAAEKALAPLLDEVRAGKTVRVILRHDLGGGDALRLRYRTSPSAGELTAIAASLRARRAELSELRAATRERAVKAAYGGDAEALAEASLALRALDDQLGEGHAAEERIQQLLSGTRWDAEERLRVAAKALGQARLDAVANALRSSGVPNIAGQISIQPLVYRETQGGKSGSVSVTPRTK
jgi:hypothetical protein